MRCPQWSWDHVADVEAHVGQAYEIAREIDDDRLIARTLYLMGSIDQMQARLAEAEANAAPEPALAHTLRNWPRVQEMQETVERVRRM